MSPNSYYRTVPPPPAADALDLDDLILSGSVLASAYSWPLPPASYPEQLLTALVRRSPEVDAGGVAAGIIHRRLEDLWREGWQPQDVVHVVDRAHPRDVRRLIRLMVESEPVAGDSVIRRWAGTVKASPAQVWHQVLALIGFLRDLPALEHLDTGRAGLGGVPEPQPGESKMLRKVRALLAKAESTEFPEEAEALTAKAQELITQHTLDTVLLTSPGGANGRARPEVTARRVHVNAPYAETKAQLLDGVATANGARTVWDRRFDISTVVGTPHDLEMIALLFASLLTQMTRAVADAGRGPQAHPHHRSRSFRRAFLMAYAHRVGQRLEASHADAVEAVDAMRATALVPLLRERREAVEAAFDELFPHVLRRSSTSVDADGWYAGVRAADHADLDLPGRAGRP